MKRYEVKFTESKDKIKEASFMINNISSAQEAIIGAMSIIGRIKNQPTMSSTIIADALITGIDSMNFNTDDEKMITTRKKIIIKYLVKNLISYNKSL